MHRLAALLAVTAVAPTLAAADEGKLVYGRSGGLFEQAPAAKATVSRLVDLPAGAGEVTAIEARGDGGLLALTFAAGAPAWIERGPTVRAVTTACAGRLHPAPAGSCLICAAGDSAAILCDRATRTADPQGRTAAQTLKDVGRDAAFLGASDAEIVALAGDNVVVTPRANAAAQRVVARCGPRSALLVAPDGQRAVAVFGEGTAARVKSFFLDGEGVARQLGGPAAPISWSPSSEWVLIQNGAQPQEGPVDEVEPLPGEGEPEGEPAEIGSAADRALLGAPGRKPAKKKPEPKKPDPPRPPPTAACVARATGGEMKCWDGYTGLGFSPDSRRVLLRRERNLYIGEINGVATTPPVRVVEDADAGAWVP